MLPLWRQHYNFFPCWSRQSGPVAMFCKEVRGWTASTLSHESERPLASSTSAPTHRRGERSGTASSLSQVPRWIISSVLKHHVLYFNSRMNKHHFGKMMCHPHTRLSVKASVLQNSAIQKKDSVFLSTMTLFLLMLFDFLLCFHPTHCYWPCAVTQETQGCLTKAKNLLKNSAVVFVENHEIWNAQSFKVITTAEKEKVRWSGMKGGSIHIGRRMATWKRAQLFVRRSLFVSGVKLKVEVLRYNTAPYLISNVFLQPLIKIHKQQVCLKCSQQQYRCCSGINRTLMQLW